MSCFFSSSRDRVGKSLNLIYFSFEVRIIFLFGFLVLLHLQSSVGYLFVSACMKLKF